MGSLTTEVRQVQNPALGGVLQWRFVIGYAASSSYASGCPLPLVFLVLPVLLHRETVNYVKTTTRASGLRGFAAKFGITKNADSDVLLTLNERACALRALSLESLQVAIRARLLTIDVQTSATYELTTTMPKSGVSEGSRELSREAEKLGRWCGDLTMAEVSSILRVRF